MIVAVLTVFSVSLKFLKTKIRQKYDNNSSSKKQKQKNNQNNNEKNIAVEHRITKKSTAPVQIKQKNVIKNCDSQLWADNLWPHTSYCGMKIPLFKLINCSLNWKWFTNDNVWHFFCRHRIQTSLSLRRWSIILNMVVHFEAATFPCLFSSGRHRIHLRKCGQVV